MVLNYGLNGFTYEEAENGQEAVDKFCATCCPAECSKQPGTQQLQDKFDFVLMDISMPVMDGFEATRKIRALEEQYGCTRTKIFALTGLGSDKAKEEAETVGVDLFLPKPVK